MTDVQAAVGLHQLPHLDEWIDERARVWDRYDALLADLPLETPPPPEAGTRHARHLYQVLVGRDAAASRDELMTSLTRRRIGVGVHYRACHLHPYYRDRYGLAPERFPVATDLSTRTLSLPLSPDLTEDDVLDVAAALADGLRGNG
jgi:dTDP-4-amino-4,6-dideoxygalactose transaminase